MPATRTPPARVTPPRRKAPLSHSPEALTYALTAAGKTQLWLADQLGISKGHMSEIAKGTRGLTPERLEQVAGLLNCPETVLLAKSQSRR